MSRRLSGDRGVTWTWTSFKTKTQEKEALEVVGAGYALIIQNDPDFMGSQNKIAQLDGRHPNGGKRLRRSRATPVPKW